MASPVRKLAPKPPTNPTDSAKPGTSLDFSSAPMLSSPKNLSPLVNLRIAPPQHNHPVMVVVGQNGQLYALQTTSGAPAHKMTNVIGMRAPSSPPGTIDPTSLSNSRDTLSSSVKGPSGDVMLSTAVVSHVGDSNSSNGSFSGNSTEVELGSAEKLSTGFREPGCLHQFPSKILSAGKKAKSLECPFCGKEFARSFPYTVHLRQHTGQKPYQCMICGRAFSQNSNVKKHIETHKVWPHEAAKPADRGPVQPPECNPESVLHFKDSSQTTVLRQKCHYCTEMYDTAGDMKKHLIEKHAEQKMFQCPLRSCRILVPDLTTTLNHVKGHEGSLIYHCPYCEKQYFSLRDVGVHQHTHIFDGVKKQSKMYNRTYQCFGCGEEYKSLENLERHQSHVSHAVSCPYSGCGKKFPSQRRLRRHIKTHYPTQYKFQCPMCDKKFPFKTSLKMHSLSHGTERFSCSVCKVNFGRKDVLQRHITTAHRNSASFICTFGGCGRSFKRKDHLKQHILIHTKPVQKVVCPVPDCGKEFKCERWMNLHKAAEHDGNLPFHCSSCKKGFRRKEALAVHIRRCVTLKDNKIDGTLGSRK